MEALHSVTAAMRDLLSFPIIDTASMQVTLGAVIYLIVSVVLLFWVAIRLQRWMEKTLLGRTPMDAGARHAVATLTRYVFLAVGVLVIVQTAGVDLTTFNVLAGAIGIGLGLGLQNVVSNLFAGLLIMLERPIKIGDRIEVDGIEGDVTEIGARSTTVITNDNIAIIVPNSKFVTEKVINWKYNDSNVRFRVPVGVAYGSDARKVEALLIEIARAEPAVLEDPAPVARLMEFGDDGLKFELLAWSRTLVHRRGALLSAVNFAIYERFNAEGIEFPFPQRDLHLRSGVLEFRRARPDRQT